MRCKLWVQYWVVCLCWLGVASATLPSETTLADALKVVLEWGVPEEHLCTNHPLQPTDLLPPCKPTKPRTTWVRSRRQRYLQESPAEGEVKDDWFYITHALCALACVVTAALAAGLTMGLLSLDPLLLLIKMRAGQGAEQVQAAKLLPIVKQHHLLLVTLLLLNSMANEALPLFLEVLVSPLVAVLLSVTLVLFFGEIIPSAIFTGPNKVQIAARLVPVVRAVMCLLYPISFPIAKLLDYGLHEDGAGESAFDRGELSALVRIQYEERMAHKQRKKQDKADVRKHLERISNRPMETVGALDFSQQQAIKATKKQIGRQQQHVTLVVPESEHEEEDLLTPQVSRKVSIHVDEVSMVEGALSMKTKVALDVFTPLHRIFAMPYDTVLTEANVVSIYSSGYSRIPVYQRNPQKPKSSAGICGILLTKQLIVVNPNDARPLNTLPLVCPTCVSPKMNLVDLLNLFQTGNLGHMALVCARPQLAQEQLDQGKALTEEAGLMGLITLEDVLESLLQEQIYDESDKLEKKDMRVAQWAYGKWKNFVKKQKRNRTGVPEHPSMATVVQDAMAHERSHLLNVGGVNPSNDPYSEGGFDPIGGLLGFFGGTAGNGNNNNN